MPPDLLADDVLDRLLADIPTDAEVIERLFADMPDDAEVIERLFADAKVIERLFADMLDDAEDRDRLLADLDAQPLDLLWREIRLRYDPPTHEPSISPGNTPTP